MYLMRVPRQVVNANDVRVSDLTREQELLLGIAAAASGQAVESASVCRNRLQRDGRRPSSVCHRLIDGRPYPPTPSSLMM